MHPSAEPPERPRPPLALLAGCAAVVVAAVLLLLAFDLDISPYRYLRNDVLFRGADSIDAVYTYATMDPSPFSVALPTDLFVRKSLRAGRLPLWDRTQGGGYATIAQGNLGVMFPLRWLMVLLPPHQAHSAFMLATLGLCFAGALLWLHDLGVSTPAAGLGAGIFALSALMQSHVLFDGVAVFLFLPWLLWAWGRWASRPGIGRFALLVVLFGLAFTSGHHMLLASVFLAVGLLAGLEALLHRRGRALLGLGLAGVWGAACAALVLLPFVVNLRGAWSYKTESSQGLSYEVPDLAGWLESLRQTVFDVGAPFLDAPGFYRHLGVVTCLLALLGAAVAWRERRLRHAAPALAIAFVLCLPGPWMAFAAHLPPLTWIRLLYLWVVLLATVALTAAVGFDWLERRAAGRVPRVAFALVAVALVGAGLLRGLPFFLPVPAEPLPVSEPYRLLREDGDRFRITALWGQNHLPNISQLTGIEDLRVIAVVMNRRYHTWFELVDPEILDKTFPTSRITNELSSPLVGAFNVKYVLAGKARHHLYLTQIRPGDVFGVFDPRARPVPQDGFELAYEDRHLKILRVDGSYRPRAFLAERVAPVTPGAEHAAAFIRAHPEALRAGAVVVEAPPESHAALAAGRGPAGEVSLDYPSDTEAVLRVDAERPALLVLNDVYEAGWRAAIDGAPAPLLPVNVMARGVWVPAGAHEVRMGYRPPGFAAGCGISAAALAALALVGGIRRRARSTG